MKKNQKKNQSEKIIVSKEVKWIKANTIKWGKPVNSVQLLRKYSR